MKKIICFMLVLLMTMSLAACGSSGESPAPATEATTPVTTPVSEQTPEDTNTEPEQESEPILMAETLLENNSQTAVFDTLNEYEQKLHELGFIEFKADFYRTTPESGPAMSPIELTFNDKAFRLVFNYTSLDYATNEEFTVNNWVLYGTKADSALNVSNFQASEFDIYDVMDMSAIDNSNTEFVHVVTYLMYETENEAPVRFVTCDAHHYPASGNLYNFVYEYEDALSPSYASPAVLAATEEDVNAVIDWEYILDVNPPADATPDPTMTIRCGSVDYMYYYEAGMTIADWVQDVNCNFDAWSITSDGTCLSPDDKYVITDINTPIEDMVDENGVIVAERSMF